MEREAAEERERVTTRTAWAESWKRHSIDRLGDVEATAFAPDHPVNGVAGIDWECRVRFEAIALADVVDARRQTLVCRALPPTDVERYVRLRRALEDRAIEAEAVAGVAARKLATAPGSAGAVKDATESVAPPTLSRHDPRILRYLAGCKTPQSLVEIAEGTDISAKTIGDRLAILRKMGLTQRPHGERGGESITDEGRRAANELPLSTR